MPVTISFSHGTDMSETVIALNGLSRRFPGMDRPAVAPLTCTIRAGYVTGLVGPDGAGNHPDANAHGLLKPDEGRASVIGFDPLKTTAPCTRCSAICHRSSACMKI